MLIIVNSVVIFILMVQGPKKVRQNCREGLAKRAEAEARDRLRLKELEENDTRRFDPSSLLLFKVATLKMLRCCQRVTGIKSVKATLDRKLEMQIKYLDSHQRDTLMSKVTTDLVAGGQAADLDDDSEASMEIYNEKSNGKVKKGKKSKGKKHKKQDEDLLTGEEGDSKYDSFSVLLPESGKKVKDKKDKKKRKKKLKDNDSDVQEFTMSFASHMSKAHEVNNLEDTGANFNQRDPQDDAKKDDSKAES